MLKIFLKGLKYIIFIIVSLFIFSFAYFCIDKYVNYELVSYNIPNYYFVNKPKDLTDVILSCESSSGFDTTQVECKFAPSFKREDLPQYFTYKNEVYHRKGYFGGFTIHKIEKADSESFRFSYLYSGLSVDGFRVYCNEFFVYGADRETFMPLYDVNFGLYMKDKNHIYTFSGGDSCVTVNTNINEGVVLPHVRIIQEYIKNYGLIDDYVYFINDRVTSRAVIFLWKGI